MGEEDEEEGSLEMWKNNLFVFLIKSRTTSLEDKKMDVKKGRNTEMINPFAPYDGCSAEKAETSALFVFVEAFVDYRKMHIQKGQGR